MLNSCFIKAKNGVSPALHLLKYYSTFWKINQPTQFSEWSWLVHAACPVVIHILLGLEPGLEKRRLDFS